MLKEKMAAWNVSRFSKPSYCLWFLHVLYSHMAAKGNLKKPISINIPDTKTSSVCVWVQALCCRQKLLKGCVHEWTQHAKAFVPTKKVLCCLMFCHQMRAVKKNRRPFGDFFLNVWTFFGVWSKFFWAGAINDGGELLTAAKYNTGKKLNDQFFFSHLVF